MSEESNEFKEFVKKFLCSLFIGIPLWESGILRGIFRVIHEYSHALVDHLLFKPTEWRFEGGLYPNAYYSNSTPENPSLLGKFLGKKLSIALYSIAGTLGEIIASIFIYFLGKEVEGKDRKVIGGGLKWLSCYTNFVSLYYPWISVFSSVEGDYSYLYSKTGIHPIFPAILLTSVYPSVILFDKLRERKKRNKAIMDALQRLVEDEVIEKNEIAVFFRNYRREKVKDSTLNRYLSGNGRIRELIEKEVKLYEKLLENYPKYVDDEENYVEELYEDMKSNLECDKDEFRRRIKKFYEGEVSSAFRAIFL